MIEIKNAKIESTFLGIEDHGILTAFLNLDYGGSAQGFGGLMFDYRPEGKWIGRPKCAEWIRHVLDITDCTEWGKLNGKMIRVKTEGYSGPIIEIGHIIRDEWYNPKDE